VPGYAHDNGLPENTKPSVIVTSAWTAAMMTVFKRTNIGVGAVIVDSLAAYNPDWGCPPGGEMTATVTGESNPEFDKDVDSYMAAVRDIVWIVKCLLGQTSVRVTFHEVINSVSI
jgi:hypothetical protein